MMRRLLFSEGGRSDGNISVVCGQRGNRCDGCIRACLLNINISRFFISQRCVSAALMAGRRPEHVRRVCVFRHRG